MKKEKMILTIIFSVSFLLRLAGQPNFPSCFHRDEIQYGYNAYSILKTGRDEWGDFLPLHFKFNGEYHVPLIIYLIALTMFFIGPKLIAIRLPAIILGSLLPILAYFFGKQFLKDERKALFLAILLALNPWQIINARASGQHSIASLFFGLLGFYLLFVFLDKKKRACLGGAVLSFIAAYFSYLGARLDIPLLLIAFLVFFRKKIPFKKLTWSVLITTIISPFLLVLIYPKRFQGTSIINKHFFPEDKNRREELTRFYQTNSLKFISQQSRALFFEFVDNYFDYLNPYYIFRNLGEPKRTNIPETGSLYLIEVMTVGWGLYGLLTSKGSKKRGFLITWLLLTPITGALTHNFPDRPNTARTVYFYFGLSLLSAWGLDLFFQSIEKTKRRKFLSAGAGMVFLVNFLFNARQLVLYADLKIGKDRGCGYLQTFQLIKELEADYDLVYVGTEYDYPYVYYLWVNKYPPAKYHQFLKEAPPENQPLLIHHYPKRPWQLENIVFKHASCLTEKKEGILYVANFSQCKEKFGVEVTRDIKEDRVNFIGVEDESGEEGTIIYTSVADINLSDGSPAFNLYSYDQEKEEAFKREQEQF